MISSHPRPAPCQWFSPLASALDRRSVGRLASPFLGADLARGRRTVTAWIRVAELLRPVPPLLHDRRGRRKADSIAARLALEATLPLSKGADRLTLALDATPTKRYEPHVQGAGVRNNPSPGPAGTPYVYDHVFVVLGRLVTHKA